MRQWIALGFDVLLPRSCVTCDRALPAGTPSPLCAACRAGIVVPGGATCARCGGPAPAFCPSCLHHSPAFTSARCLGPYRPGDPHDVLSRAVQRLKYHGHRGLAEPLADLLAAHYPFPDTALVVPVPLHLSRLRARGYNQALLLARGLARRRGLVCDARVLVRTRQPWGRGPTSQRARRVPTSHRHGPPPHHGGPGGRRPHDRRHRRCVHACAARRRCPGRARLHRRPHPVTLW